MKKQIWIDCCGGADDILALQAALSQKELEIIGISTEPGRESSQAAARRLRDLLRKAGRESIPCLAGSQAPLVKKPDASLSCPAAEGAEEPGYGDITDELRSRILAHAGITLVALGPLTNLARTLLAHPEVGKAVGEIRIAGGTHGSGNVVPRVEYHIWADPHAAYLVLGSGIPVSLLTLDACEGLRIPEDIPGETGKLVQASVRENRALQGLPLILSLTEPELFDFRSYRVDTELKSSLCLGQTVIDLTGVSGKQPNARVALTGDGQAFETVCRNCLRTIAAEAL